MPNNFFKHNDKVYSENLNDGILVGNCFDVTLGISLPDNTDGVFPSTNEKVKAKVADVTPTPNSNLGVGERITNNTSSSQEYRLTVYPNFNRFGGFEKITVTGEGCSVRICEKGESNPIINNLDYNNLSNVSQLKELKEYDIVVTIQPNKSCTGLNFVFITTSNDGVVTISQNNVDGLNAALNDLGVGVDNLKKFKKVYEHSDTRSDMVNYKIYSNGSLAYLTFEKNDLHFFINVKRGTVAKIGEEYAPKSPVMGVAYSKSDEDDLIYFKLEFSPNNTTPRLMLGRFDTEEKIVPVTGSILYPLASSFEE